MHQIEYWFSKFSRGGSYSRTPTLERTGVHLRGGGLDQVFRQVNAYVCHIKVCFCRFYFLGPCLSCLMYRLFIIFCHDKLFLWWEACKLRTNSLVYAERFELPTASGSFQVLAKHPTLSPLCSQLLYSPSCLCLLFSCHSGLSAHQFTSSKKLPKERVKTQEWQIEVCSTNAR